ncbi:hypothetical protein [Chryseobacterium sp. BIGb0232]|uniref:hypothetical protein n=1 Tax=Chryseobacterium sp. BIGb0232 TaxID=2940598 RepID=UPI000F48F80A|nr:hypothetical protein [Chryseobacterium sp. BIGb0232]MCS4305333.1 hypothetical protein [Chryseobacterium sp. BIGb0232]ROS07544.1 hypothetical protein EDF65_4931 [Chryseobacterium nakagawai]
MSKTFNYIFIGLAGGVILFIISCIVFIGIVFSDFGGKGYSVTELEEEYLENKAEINDLIQYYYKIKPSDKVVDIEFKNDKVLERITITHLSKSKQTYQNWNINITDLTVSKLKAELNWTDDEIKILKEKLDNANCISIKDGEPVKIGFKRSGLGMYSFNVFQNRDTDRNMFNDGCQYILRNHNLALEYGGGAIGPQCFPNK